MSLEEFFEYFERIEFEFKADHASSYAGFKSILDHDEAFGNLVSESADVDYAQAVANRIEFLLAADAEPEFAHPNDVSVATYIVALTETHPEMIKPLLTEGPPIAGLFWARFAVAALKAKLDMIERQTVDE